MAASEFSAQSVGVAVACGIGAVLSGASVLANSASVFLQPVAEAFHWSDSRITGYMLIGLAAAGLFTPAIGRLVDRFGARPVALAGAVLFALATMALSQLDGTAGRACLLFGLAGAAAPALGAVAFNKVLSGWFEGRRGIVLAMVGMGGAIGGFAVPRIAEFMMHYVDWRGAYIGLGLVVLLGTLPVLFIFFREPAAASDRPAGLSRRGAVADTPMAVGATVVEVLRSPPFWLLVGAIAANVFVGVGLQFHVVPLLTDRGLAREVAVNVSTDFAFGQIAGQLLAGWLLDRYDTPRVVIPFFAASLVGLVMLAFTSGSVLLITAGLLLRVGVGAELSIAPYLLVRYFGLRAFGQVYGVLFLISTVAAGAGVQLLSICHDKTDSYGIALVASQILLLLGLVLIGQLGPYRYPKHLAAGDPHAPA
ncbi:MAG TPA: MFS transporter, partial [Stellaceae bacterium]|nr:MFS transporter [Stellaceae bacterium]